MERIGEKDIDTLQMVLTRFHRSEQYCSPWHEKMKDWYKRYRSYKDPQENPYKNNVFDRLTFTLVETHVSMMMQSIFAVEPWGSVIGVDNHADPKVAKQLEKALDVINSNPDRELFLEVMDWEKQNAIMGISYLNVVPLFDFRPVSKKSTMQRPWIFDGIGFECQEAMDIFPDPSAKRISKCKWVIKRSVMYYDEMLEMEKNGIYENVKDIKGDESNIDSFVAERLSEIGYTSWDEFHDPLTGSTEILDYFEDGHVITIGARKVVLRDTRKKGEAPLPYHLPVIDLRFCQVPGEFFGIGIPEILSDDQDYINLIRSQRLDNIELILNKMWITRSGGSTSPDDLVSFPGAVIFEDEKGDVREVQFSDILGSGYKEEEAVKYSAQDAVGELELARGSNTQNERTATGIMRLQEATQIRRDTRVKAMELSGIRQILKKEVQILREFCSQDQYERFIGEPDAGFYQMSLDDIFDLYDVKPVGSSVTANKDLRVQQVQQAQAMLMQLPPQITTQGPTPFVVDVFEATKMGLESLDIKNIDELLKQQQQPPMQQGMLPPGQGMAPDANILEQLMMGAGGGQPQPAPVMQPQPEQQGVL